MQEDLNTVLAPDLPGLDRERVRDWYNGYSWDGTERVYNPFDVLLLAARRFNAWWFETGTPESLGEISGGVQRACPDLGWHGRQRRAAVDPRRCGHRDRDAAVPNQLPDNPAEGGPQWESVLAAGLLEPRGAPESECEPLGPTRAS